MSVTVSIIIINYNTKQLTINCIRSVIEQTKNVTYEIILVDNASTETDPAIFLDVFPSIKLVVSPMNKGFSGGNNLGIDIAQGEYVLLLNSDTELVNDAVSIAVEKMKSDLSIGALSAQLIYPDGTPQPVIGRFPSLKNELFELLRIYKFESKVKRQIRLQGDLWNYSIPTETDWIWGAFFLIPTPILKQFPNQKLHDDFFMYFEDVQWCYFIHHSLNRKIVYAPDALVIHHLAGSSEIKDPILNFKNKILPNQRRFLIQEYGNMYTFLFYVIKALHYVTLKGKSNKIKSKEYFRFAFSNSI